ncbi:protein DEFECTIVE IN MERISTEM SILENCING 3-like [Aristolochia californica]|uniref:protein DEFECTIVE IN MERISTEM SILENCING 3-like n=1 Tax=Aristolochia californica TaxID=171875 RepID=UPI0035DA5666
MFSPNQVRIPPLSNIKKLSSPEPSISNHTYQDDLSLVPRGDMRDDTIQQVESLIGQSQKLQEDLQKLGLKIKHHEDNWRILKTQTNNLDESILDMQGKIQSVMNAILCIFMQTIDIRLGKYHSPNAPEVISKNLDDARSEQQTTEQILKQKTVASIVCQLKVRYGPQASQMPLMKNVLGIVAMLGKVSDDNLSWVFSEYLGLEIMMAVVCKTHEAVKALEIYDKEGQIDRISGLHGLSVSIGKQLDGRYLVICLEDLRPYLGQFLVDDPQRKLALLNPRLPNGESPRGFLGFAVNMIHVDNVHFSYVTAEGHGLRETLFYSIFSRLQVYKTRAAMQVALPCITEGAVSLDGGIIKGPGVFSLGTRKDLEVRFPVSSGKSSLPADIIETEEQLRLMIWGKERITEDMQREQALLQHVKSTFGFKRDEFMNFISRASPTSPYMAQNQGHTAMREDIRNEF